MKTKLLLLAFTLIATHVYADGDKGGNGGKAVRCPDGRYEVLDYQRMREFGLTAITDIAGATPLEKALNIVKRIEKINPLRAKFYTAHLNGFESNTIAADDNDMIDMTVTDDTSEVGYCKGGKIEQVIRQITPKTERQRRYLVHQARFAELSPFQAAILMVHEVILFETRVRMLKGADYAVTLNTFLISNELDIDLAKETGRESYAKVLQAAGLLYHFKSGETDASLSNVQRALESAKHSDGQTLGVMIDELSADVAMRQFSQKGGSALIGKSPWLDLVLLGKFPLGDGYHEPVSYLAVLNTVGAHPGLVIRVWSLGNGNLAVDSTVR